MASNHCLYLAHIFLLIASASSSYISYDALKSGKLSGRSLLQAKKDCPVNLEAQNYTIITSKCKGPNYPAKACCEALLEFSCGFVDEINDLETNCAETMFSYINLYGQYPPGLFANQCKEGSEGLSCAKVLEAKSAEKDQLKKSAAPPPYQARSLAALCSTAFLLLLVYSLF